MTYRYLRQYVLINFYMFFQSDSVSYFFDELDRISRVDYIPSNKDILHCRKATKGVFEFTIRIQVSYECNINFKLMKFSRYRKFLSLARARENENCNLKRDFSFVHIFTRQRRRHGEKLLLLI